MVPYSRCRHCRRHRREGITISHSGACPECGERRLVETLESLHNHHGDPYERWRAGLLRALMKLPGG